MSSSGLGEFKKSKSGTALINTGMLSYLNHVFDPAVCVPFNHRLHPDERLHVCVETIRHEFKLAVRRNERDCTVVVEPRQTHTLMKLDVFQLHRLALASASALKENLQYTTPQKLNIKHSLDTRLVNQTESAVVHGNGPTY